MNPVKKIKNNLVGVKCDIPNCSAKIKEGEIHFVLVVSKNEQHYCLKHEEALKKNIEANRVLDLWEELNITRRCILHRFFHYIIFVNQHKDSKKFNSKQEKIDMVMSCIKRDLGEQKTSFLVKDGDERDMTKISKDIIQPVLKNIGNEIEKGYVPPERINLYKQMLNVEQDQEAMNKIAQNVIDTLQEVKGNKKIIEKLLEICSTIDSTDSIKDILQNYDTAFQIREIINQLKIIKSLKLQYDKENKKLGK